MILKKNSFIVLFVCFMINSNTLFSQKGKSIYVEYKTVIENVVVNKKHTPQEKKMINQMGNDLLAMRFHLYCNDSIAVFKKIEDLTIENPSPIQKVIGSEVYTVDFNKKENIMHLESMGELYRVLYPFEQYKWQITTEIKVIDGYTCYKATTTKSVFSQLKNRMVTTTPTVWFAPAIPATAGPFGLNGLPGLILEATLNNKTSYAASLIKVDYKVKNKKEFVIPNKGKLVSEAELEGIQMSVIKKN